MADHNYQAQVKRLGVPDKYIGGTQAELWRECEYDQQAIAEQVQQMVRSKSSHNGLEQDTLTESLLYLIGC